VTEKTIGGQIRTTRTDIANGDGGVACARVRTAVNGESKLLTFAP
jgi:hypothetical protein